MKLTVIGSGDAFSSGGRFNSCYHFEADTTSFLLECGASAMTGIRQYGIDPLKIDTIFISHLHGDHFGGLPFFFLDAKYVSKRRTPLVLIGPKALQERVSILINTLYPGINLSKLPFEIRYATLNQFQLLSSNGVTVQAFPAKHSRESDPYCMRLSYKKKTIGYSGDTAWTNKLLSVAINSDLFITECSQWDEASEVHMDYMTLVRKYDDLQAQNILLTHMNPSMLEKIDEIDTEKFLVAHDGKVITM